MSNGFECIFLCGIPEITVTLGMLIRLEKCQMNVKVFCGEIDEIAVTLSVLKCLEKCQSRYARLQNSLINTV